MKWHKRIIGGLELGSFIYLLLCLLGDGVLVSPKTVLMVFAISAFVGLTTVLFDLEKLNFLQALIIHYLLVSAFVIASFAIFYRIENLLQFWLNLTGIYVISYLVMMVKTKLTARQLNEQLMQLKKNQ
ncbi:DUF3021 family protein [Enterococcus sp. HY326]|uniref:DUF3021 family protein n=1 Tax=Enterococcus sp. HY326 TaxID=2971265 RepID=UPI0022405965|nr:DUF3021 family protein [Enterococcus sp. HY326]